MKVTSNKNISFPGLGWGVNKGETRELPEEEIKQKIILEHPAISKVENNKTPKVEGVKNNNKLNN